MRLIQVLNWINGATAAVKFNHHINGEQSSTINDFSYFFSLSRLPWAEMEKYFHLSTCNRENQVIREMREYRHSNGLMSRLMRFIFNYSPAAAPGTRNKLPHHSWRNQLHRGDELPANSRTKLNPHLSLVFCENCLNKVFVFFFSLSPSRNELNWKWPMKPLHWHCSCERRIDTFICSARCVSLSLFQQGDVCNWLCWLASMFSLLSFSSRWHLCPPHICLHFFIHRHRISGSWVRFTSATH